MQKIPESIEALLAPVVTAAGYRWVGGEFRGGPDGLLRVYIDRPEGITLDDCTVVSDAVSGVLDVEDPFPGFYRLEVSSPGLERPLFRATDFAEFVGRVARVRLRRPIQQRRRIEGEILGVEGEQIRMQIAAEGIEIAFAYEEVERANLVFDFGDAKRDRPARRASN
ncbi:ribosome maturation factor RimP [Halothiobacillus sp. DCM-1]|uniref:ribosome maturation factor RimP n=1 Tax=Halothiobacillus sp. DCM-1 TaxID=3112558 RepID=UPI003253EDFF